MIDLEKHAYMLQCYKCYKCTSGDFRAWDKGPKRFPKNFSAPPNYWKISGKTTYYFFSDLCRC